MPGLPVISGRQCIGVLTKLGYIAVRTRGSHVRLRAPSRDPVTVPLHQELDRRTLRAILRTVEINVEEFTRLLGR